MRLAKSLARNLKYQTENVNDFRTGDEEEDDDDDDDVLWAARQAGDGRVMMRFGWGGGRGGSWLLLGQLGRGRRLLQRCREVQWSPPLHPPHGRLSRGRYRATIKRLTRVIVRRSLCGIACFMS